MKKRYDNTYIYSVSNLKACGAKYTCVYCPYIFSLFMLLAICSLDLLVLLFLALYALNPKNPYKKWVWTQWLSPCFVAWFWSVNYFLSWCYSYKNLIIISLFSFFCFFTREKKVNLCLAVLHVTLVQSEIRKYLAWTFYYTRNANQISCQWNS